MRAKNAAGDENQNKTASYRFKLYWGHLRW